MPTVLAVLGAYLIGSVSFAILLSRLAGMPDPRSYGSRNPGATNVLRSGNRLIAGLTLLGDGAKGWLAVYLAQLWTGHSALDGMDVPLAGVAVFLGHLFPVFHRFAGGSRHARDVGGDFRVLPHFVARGTGGRGVRAVLCLLALRLAAGGSRRDRRRGADGLAAQGQSEAAVLGRGRPRGREA